jgi:Skp family chaperone for outer membrane proteins
MPAAAAGRFAVVDVEGAMNSIDHWKTAVAALQKQRAEKQATLEAKQKELKQKKEKLDAQKAVSDPKATAPLEEELYKDAQVLTESFMKSQQELTAREKKLAEQMLGRIEAIVRDIATAGEYDFVFETGTKEAPNVLYSQKSLDITNRVVEEYKKRFKDKPLEK